MDIRSQQRRFAMEITAHIKQRDLIRGVRGATQSVLKLQRAVEVASNVMKKFNLAVSLLPSVGVKDG